MGTAYSTPAHEKVSITAPDADVDAWVIRKLVRTYLHGNRTAKSQSDRRAGGVLLIFIRKLSIFIYTSSSRHFGQFSSQLPSTAAASA